jgi:signal transduction histidine kinase
VTVRCDASADVPPLPVDGLKIEGLLINLLTNAIQASPPGSEVIVRIRAHGDGQELAVEDHGHGIAEEVRSRICDPFFSTREQQGGTGLGLSIVHGIVEQHGGRLVVRSQRHQGTTVTAILPYPTTAEVDAT